MIYSEESEEPNSRHRCRISSTSPISVDAKSMCAATSVESIISSRQIHHSNHGRKKSFHTIVRLMLVATFVTQCCHAQRRQPSIQVGGGGGTPAPSTGRQPPPPDQPLINERAHRITFGAILPTTALITVRRAYYKRISDSVENLMRGRQAKFNFTNHYRISQAQVVMISLNPSPTEVLSTLCQQLLVKDVSTVIYMTNSDIYGHNVASAQYLMQLTGYLGIPMIAWNADNIGLEQRVSESRILQLAPSVEHQASAMLSILKRYSWHSFSVVTSSIGGHGDFIRAVRDKILSTPEFKYTILDIFTIKSKSRQEIKSQLQLLAKSEARVILLYSSKEEAQEIFYVANTLQLTGKNYIWIVTQSVVGTASESYAPGHFPTGMLGIHFNTSHLRLLDEIERAVTIFGHGLDLFVSDPRNLNTSLSPKLSCNGSSEPRWHKGDIFFKYLRNVSIKTKTGKPNLEFNPDGTLKFVELDVVNLKKDLNWEKIGVWTEEGLEIKDITWPDNSPVPPQGVPEKFHLKVTFLDEPSFVSMNDPDNNTGECITSQAIRCRYAPESELEGVNLTLAYRDPRYYRCCSGFCIDLLQKFADDLKFTFELNRVEDGTWGALTANGTWNGLIAELLNHKADIVVTSIKINSDRQAYVDFTVPFLETGITIVVAKKTGIISPKAFLEPFDTISWIMILLISIQVAAFAIFVFEWMSPSGYDMKMKPPRDHKFSLFRTYWLVWAILFGAAVPVNCPRGYTSRFMANVWATFAVVFLAIYTANLAAFMITREDYFDFTGIEDPRLVNPHLTGDAPLRFGTIPHGNTESVLKRNKPMMHAYMKKFNRTSSMEGVRAVKKNELDAFIYDAVVLDYLTGLDPECRLLTVGSWYAMTGYGFALPKKSKYLAKFNEKMIEYRENGDLERLRKFWFQGACKQSKNKGMLSKPLDVNQFMSAFLLLGCGILLTIALLALEHFYFRYFRVHLAKTDKDGCFNLVSLSMATSLTLPEKKSSDKLYAPSSKCQEVSCETKYWKLLYELNVAKRKIKQLQQQQMDSSTGPHTLQLSSSMIREQQHQQQPPMSVDLGQCWAVPFRSTMNVEPYAEVASGASLSTMQRNTADNTIEKSSQLKRRDNNATGGDSSSPRSFPIVEIETVL